MRELTPGQLKQLMAGSRENAFLIVDVRQAAEYPYPRGCQYPPCRG
jgi:hypothetical protein